MLANLLLPNGNLLLRFRGDGLLMPQLLMNDRETLGGLRLRLPGLFDLLPNPLTRRHGRLVLRFQHLDAVLQLRCFAKQLCVFGAVGFQVGPALSKRRLRQVEFRLLLLHAAVEVGKLRFRGVQLLGRFRHHLLGVAGPRGHRQQLPLEPLDFFFEFIAPRELAPPCRFVLRDSLTHGGGPRIRFLRCPLQIVDGLLNLLQFRFMGGNVLAAPR